MSSVNKVLLLGRIEDFASKQIFGDGIRTLMLTLVTTENNGKINAEHNEWHDVVLPDQLAFKANELTKGSNVYVEGIIRTRTFVDKSGIKRYHTHVVASKISKF